MKYKNNLTVSVIIPTKNRKDDLGEVIRSILRQTLKPFKIIVVDQSDNGASKKKIEKIMKGVSRIGLVYILNSQISGLTQARNIGVKASNGDIVVFLDDDVILEDDYIEAMIEIFRNYPSIYGVGGLINGKDKKPILKKIGYYLFYLGPFRDRREEFYMRSREMMKTDRLSGCNAGYRKGVFNSFHFDENLKGYSCEEDEDFSYRVSEKYQLCLIQKARLTHKVSTISRSNIQRISIGKIFEFYYFFYKNIKKTPFNILCYLWLNLGYLLEPIFGFNFASLNGTLLGFKKVIKSILKKNIIKEVETM